MAQNLRFLEIARQERTRQKMSHAQSTSVSENLDLHDMDLTYFDDICDIVPMQDLIQWGSSSFVSESK